MCAKSRLPVFQAETAAIPARQAPAESEVLGENPDRSAESHVRAESLSGDREIGFSPRPAPEPPADDEAWHGWRDALSAGPRSDGTGRTSARRRKS